ncbi:hypothetical protein RF11_11109 [Thelohanellus kitauei]|uniref:Uncharacterized protein n=1 Tax=Thelohanellus kitauei TaxID=669202 RepID=A0A0C2JJ90_THEKT|nr:hypothetical protein RF11_11109 [Thelohanellus kitauei]
MDSCLIFWDDLIIVISNYPFASTLSFTTYNIKSIIGTNTSKNDLRVNGERLLNLNHHFSDFTSFKINIPHPWFGKWPTLAEQLLRIPQPIVAWLPCKCARREEVVAEIIISISRVHPIVSQRKPLYGHSLWSLWFLSNSKSPERRRIFRTLQCLLMFMLTTMLFPYESQS